MKYNFDFFKNNEKKIFNGFVVQYDFFEKGDFGDLQIISFENEMLAGGIYFWSSGVLSADIFNYQAEDCSFDILCWADEKEKQEELIERVLAVLRDHQK